MDETATETTPPSVTGDIDWSATLARHRVQLAQVELELTDLQANAEKLRAAVPLLEQLAELANGKPAAAVNANGHKEQRKPQLKPKAANGDMINPIVAWLEAHPGNHRVADVAAGTGFRALDVGVTLAYLARQERVARPARGLYAAGKPKANGLTPRQRKQLEEQVYPPAPKPAEAQATANLGTVAIHGHRVTRRKPDLYECSRCGRTRGTAGSFTALECDVQTP